MSAAGKIDTASKDLRPGEEAAHSVLPEERASSDEARAGRDIASGRKVLELEAEALVKLSETLGPEFARAVEMLAGLSDEDNHGRVIVTGIGKSGHIGKKMAATFASTGTPAQFVHAAEASHGDLGMITGRDRVIAISNSGETQELGDLVQYSRRFSIPLIAITSNGESTLAQSADVVLVLPKMPEAGTVGLAPTTSTTMTLALGDALAVALLERKGFSADQFRRFHPGGKLGRQLIRVRDLMHQGDEIPLVSGDPTMDRVIVEMTAKRFGCIGVVNEDGSLEGIVTDGDLRRHMSADLINRKVRDVMTRNPVVATPNELAAETVALMNDMRIGAIFVVEESKPVGIVHFHDFLRAGVA